MRGGAEAFIGETMDQIDEPTRPIDDDIAWQAVISRDRRFDGRFVTGVLSTGIYCRPSCAARHPARKNVRFFATGEQAREAGLRACLRCRPDDIARDEEALKRVIETIRSSHTSPKLDELAARVGYSPSHLQKLFTRAVGLSPAAYFRALRAEIAMKRLSVADKVTHAIFDAGYESLSRFYENTKERLGMIASAWKDGARNIDIHWAVVKTSLGPMLVAATAKGICRLSFNEGESDLQAKFPNARLHQGGAEFETLLAQVVKHVERPGSHHDIPVDVQGTAFQEAVWRELRKIPAGETRSYAQIAAAAGKPNAVRAAGSANGANTVAVLIPCHRVIRSDGGLGGYAYGSEIKRQLLDREASGPD